MTHTMRQILADALTLPPMDRAELIEELFFSFDTSDRRAMDQIWAEEAERRIEAFRRGEFVAIPANEVFAELTK